MRDFFSEKADILIVDDEPINRKIVNKMLMDRFETREAASGEEAINLVDEKKPDLILLDVHMPGMNGHEVIQRLKAHEETKGIPVVFVTADGDRETEASGLMEGADDFITKPFRQDILVQRISRIIELHFLQNNLKEEVARQTAKAEERSRKIEQMSLQTLLTLANIIDSRDQYSAGHSLRVSQYATLMGEALGWDSERIENLRYAALLHNIGNIGVPENILNNPKELNENEFKIIRSHADAGADMLKNKILVKGAEDVARHHHERFDGTGYPSGIAGENISTEARIVAIADAFDAMKSKRVYRRSYSPEHIREELIEGKGKQFDPYLLDVFLGLLDHGMIDKLSVDVTSTEEGLDGSSALLQTVMKSFVSQNGVDDFDVTTGLYSRTAGEKNIAHAMQEDAGCFVFFDVDNLKKINDTNGHKSGDKVLRLMGDTLKANSDEKLCCRLGGDEFIVFYPNISREDVEKQIQKIILEFTTEKNNVPDISVASLSAGLVMCNPADAYIDVYNRADKALYYVKQNGKEGYSFYNEDNDSTAKTSVDINKLVRGIKTSGSYEGAMDVEYRQFTKLFEYVANLEKRYDHSFKLIMISIETSQDASVEEIERAMLCMEQSIRQTIRNVDIVTRYSKEQFLAILLEASSDGVQIVIDRIFNGFYDIFGSDKFKPYYTIADLKK